MRRLAALAGCLAVAGVLALSLLGPHEAGAQTPGTPDSSPTASPTPDPTRIPGRPLATDAQALMIEQQLLCPVCTNERLDVCSTAICNDMKQVIRERLAAGSTPDDIILFFETRYGPKVRAALPKQGINLVLFGWVGGALVLTGAAAAYALYSLRRDSRRRLARAAVATPPADDRWVDALVDEAAEGAEDDDAPRGAR
jgi:cytochrome c-type biogenesis protein CcmH/NrfF